MSEVGRGSERDVLGARLKIGVLIPSTNTVVEPEYNGVVPSGVTVHAGRLLVDQPRIDDDEAFHRLIDQVRGALYPTVDRLVTCEPDLLTLGMTALSFLGGVEGDRRLAAEVSERAGLPVVSGPRAMADALRELRARSVGLVSPYQPFAEDEAVRFFEEDGFDVVRVESLRSPSATAIARVDRSAILDRLQRVDGPDVDVIVQVGTNLAMAHLVADAEHRFGKPVLAINVVTVWSALRRHGLHEPIPGFGTLLARGPTERVERGD